MERHAWTDERIDDLADRVGTDVGRLDRRTELMAAETRDLRKEMHEGFSRLEDRIDRLTHQMLQGTIVLAGMQLATIVALVVKG